MSSSRASIKSENISAQLSAEGDLRRRVMILPLILARVVNNEPTIAGHHCAITVCQQTAVYSCSSQASIESKNVSSQRTGENESFKDETKKV